MPENLWGNLEFNQWLENDLQRQAEAERLRFGAWELNASTVPYTNYITINNDGTTEYLPVPKETEEEDDGSWENIW